MKKYIVGITPRIDYPNNNKRLQVNYSYLVPFNTHHIIPLILPLDCSNVNELLDLCDAFCVIGGDDINPVVYGEINKGLSKDVNESLDEIDRLVIQHAYNNNKPMLGICRGIQSINVFLGGTLYQDIQDANLKHDCDNHQHLVNKINSTELTELLPNEFMVNSYHHQVVNKLAKDFVAIYQYQDVIEGIQHIYKPILAVQWHPERFNSSESDIIFEYFISLIKKEKSDLS